MQAVAVLVPELLAIVSQGGQYSKDIQRRALEIMHTVVSTLSTLSGDELKQMQALLGPMIGPWFAQFGRILSSATDAQVRPSRCLAFTGYLHTAVGQYSA